MVAEETNIKLVAPVIRQAPAAELPAVAADAALMKRLQKELGETDFQTAKEMLTKGLLWKGTFERTTDTKNTYESSLRHARSEITISKDVHFVEEGTFGPGGFNALKLRLMAAVTNHLSRKFKVRIATPGKPPQSGDGDYPIVVDVNDAPAADYPVHLHGGEHGRSSMSEDEGTVYELGQSSDASVPEVELAHESGHMILGASDEYANFKVRGRIPLTDNSLMGDYRPEGMALAQIKARHFKFLIEYVSKYYPDRDISIVP
jgi:hypothetical protein